jgi:hypothetical protein
MEMGWMALPVFLLAIVELLFSVTLTFSALMAITQR